MFDNKKICSINIKDMNVTKIWINKNNNRIILSIFRKCLNSKGNLQNLILFLFEKRIRRKILEWWIYFLFKWDQVAITHRSFSYLDNCFFIIQKVKCMKRTKIELIFITLRMFKMLQMFFLLCYFFFKEFIKEDINSKKN